MSLPMNSILEELRCMDGELFKSELTQRLYILLKTQAQETINFKVSNKKQLYAKILEWPAAVRDEELSILRKKSNEIDSLFTQVALLYVKLSHKAVENRTVRIRTPRLEDMVKTFYQNIISNAWCASDELWKFDPIKLDFVLRECFRKAVMDSVQVIQNSISNVQSAPSVVSSSTVTNTKQPRKFHEEDDDDEVYPEDSISSFLQPEQPKTIQKQVEKLQFQEEDSSSSSDSSSSEDEKETIIQSRKIFDDGNTIVGGNKNTDNATVIQKEFKQQSDNKTVTFKLPKGAASVTSSVSDDSSNSKYFTAVNTQPKFIPIIREDDEDNGDDDSSESSKNSVEKSNDTKEDANVLRVVLSKGVDEE